MMQLKAGLRLKSTTCSTELIVVQAPKEAIDLRCGGAPVAELSSAAAQQAANPAFQGGTVIGKRYIDEGERLEVLVTKAGQGSLSLGETPLKEKPAKKLPSSD